MRNWQCFSTARVPRSPREIVRDTEDLKGDLKNFLGYSLRKLEAADKLKCKWK